MRTRTLGYTGEELTTMGLGTWAIGGGDWAYAWGPQDDAQSIATVRRALDLGINWIDTAAVYGLGRSEEVVGRAIEGRRDDVFIATKCGLVWSDEDRTPTNRLEAESIRQECEDSLRRLGVDVIDLYQIHWPSPDEDLEEAWTTIAELAEEGKIRYAGLSNSSVDQLKRAQAIHPVASLQPPYSMMRRAVEDELLGYCADNDIGVVVYSPMQAGLLTGKFSHEYVENLPDDDWRKSSRAFVEPRLSVNLEFVEQLRPIAERNEKTLPQLAIAWVLRREEVTAAIVGARRPDQIEETAPAADWVLSDEDVAEIDRLLAERDDKLEAVAA